MAKDQRPFQRLRDRIAGLPIDDSLHDDVPDWLEGPLREWLAGALRGEDFLARRVMMRLQWALDVRGFGQQGYAEHLLNCPQQDLLTVIDAVLQLYPRGDSASWRRLRDLAGVLDAFLIDGSSLYQVGQEWCLVRRVDTTLQQAVNTAVESAPRQAAEHLRAAWTHTYGRTPDPDKAYDLAVVAIEEVACPLVCPKNTVPTLGIVLRDLRSRGSTSIGTKSRGSGRGGVGVARMVVPMRVSWVFALVGRLRRV
ncbi:Uncharacterised protein [Mycobacterium tuberculosis]|nr:Uncharacterised protein [Mycobacterium tuberculosis]